jgi:hypothetical protein
VPPVDGEYGGDGEDEGKGEGAEDAGGEGEGSGKKKKAAKKRTNKGAAKRGARSMTKTPARRQPNGVGRSPYLHHCRPCVACAVPSQRAAHDGAELQIN